MITLPPKAGRIDSRSDQCLASNCNISVPIAIAVLEKNFDAARLQLINLLTCNGLHGSLSVASAILNAEVARGSEGCC